MKRTASAKRNSRSNAGSISRCEDGLRRAGYVMCVKTGSFAHSLQLRKVYRRLPVKDTDHGWWRIVDDEGEDYLYPRDYFIPVSLSPAVARAVSALKD